MQFILVNSTQGVWQMLWILLTNYHFTSAAHKIASFRLLGRLGKQENKHCIIWENKKTNSQTTWAIILPVLLAIYVGIYNLATYIKQCCSYQRCCLGNMLYISTPLREAWSIDQSWNWSIDQFIVWLINQSINNQLFGYL